MKKAQTILTACGRPAEVTSFHFKSIFIQPTPATSVRPHSLPPNLAEPRNHTRNYPRLLHLQVQAAKLDPCVWHCCAPFAMHTTSLTSVIGLQCCVHIWIECAATGEHSNSQSSRHFCWACVKPCLSSPSCSSALTCSYPVQLCTCMPVTDPVTVCHLPCHCGNTQKLR